MFDLLKRALARREPLRAATDALRLVDGRGDGFADLEIDDFAGHWLVQTRGADFPEWLRDVKQATSIYWKPLGEKIAPHWMSGHKLEAPFCIGENGVSYEIDFAAGYSQGIFLDQRENRRALREMAAGQTVLNCFAYTCAFGVSAALGGARTVNVDLSKRYLDWGKRNYALNNVNCDEHDFIFGDVANWLERFARQRRAFDIIVLDPPTFSRNEKGRVFKIEDDFHELVRAAEKILNANGTLFCSTNQRSLAPAAFRQLIRDGLARPDEWKFTPAPMPPDFCGEPYLKAAWLRRVTNR